MACAKVYLTFLMFPLIVLDATVITMLIVRVINWISYHRKDRYIGRYHELSEIHR